MLEEIYNLDDNLSEDEYYDALLFLLGDAYPDLDEEQLEDLLEDMLDQLPEQYAENVMNTIGTIGKQIGSGALKFASNNPALVKGALTAAGTIVGGPIGAKLGSGLGNIITGAGQNKFLPETGKTLALMQNPQAQAAITRATLGIGNGSAPLSLNGNISEVPIATYLRAIIASAQAALQELDRNNIVPHSKLMESIPFSGELDQQAIWLAESLSPNIYNPFIESMFDFDPGYHIFEDHRIELRIPFKYLNTPLEDPWPESGKINYYYYIDGSPHLIAVLPYHKTDARQLGLVNNSFILKNYTKVEEYPSNWINDDNIDARKKYYYKNGDIVVEGVHSNKIVVYSKSTYNEKTLLIKMPDELKLKIKHKKFFYSFFETQRRYCHPDCFAGFIGALGQCNFEDIQCTGISYGDATCYPSVSHNNGRSIDTLYLSDMDNQQILIDAFKSFYFQSIFKGTNKRFSKLNNAIADSGHNDHLHAGNFNHSKIKLIISEPQFYTLPTPRIIAEPDALKVKTPDLYERRSISK